jgi:hypothetical protein
VEQVGADVIGGQDFGELPSAAQLAHLPRIRVAVPGGQVSRAVGESARGALSSSPGSPARGDRSGQGASCKLLV